MKTPGDVDDLYVRSRGALLDALDALDAHRDSVVVIGAQAVYLHTGAAAVAIAEATKDADLALDPCGLGNDPLVEAAMTQAGFYPDLEKGQPGAWLSPDGIPVDLMVPERLAGAGGRRGARIPPHDKHATRRAKGLEATVVDHEMMDVAALDTADARVHRVRVAGPSALIVAKAHKIGERVAEGPDRLADKDAHDIYRILVAIETDALTAGFERLLADDLSGETTEVALGYLADHFAAGPDAAASEMAGRAEAGIGEPETVALQTAILARDLLDSLRGRPRGDVQT